MVLKWEEANPLNENVKNEPPKIGGSYYFIWSRLIWGRQSPNYLNWNSIVSVGAPFQ
jgi:hypothetical protein